MTARAPSKADRLQRTRVEQEIAAETRTIVIGPYLKGRSRAGDRSDGKPSVEPARAVEDRLAEAVGLARAIDLDVVEQQIVMLAKPRPATFLGSGKVEEIAGIVAGTDAVLVVMDGALTPVQQRNLEKAWGCKVIDRTGLILEIFGRRARTREGTLQVELAHLDYQKSRLVRSWTHLERQRGGFGFLGGPGETQIEADRRLIQERMRRIERELESVKQTRSLHRASRRRVPYPIVALVGYTNAGKSTLFNRLTGAEVFAEDQLFATLDPTSRAVRLPHGETAILSDTVGFISDLPTMLVAAFRATLEDVIEADVLLHVRDISHGQTEAEAADVKTVLEQIGIDLNDRGRIVEVWNKADLLSAEERERLRTASERTKAGERPSLVSAVTGEGLPELLDAIEGRIAHDRPAYRIHVESGDGAILNWLHEHTEVLAREDEPAGPVRLTVRVTRENEARLLARHPDSRKAS